MPIKKLVITTPAAACSSSVLVLPLRTTATLSSLLVAPSARLQGKKKAIAELRSWDKPQRRFLVTSNLVLTTAHADMAPGHTRSEIPDRPVFALTGCPWFNGIHAQAHAPTWLRP